MAVSTGDFTVVEHLKQQQQQNLGYNSQRTLNYNTSHTDMNYYMSGKLQSKFFIFFNPCEVTDIITGILLSAHWGWCSCCVKSSMSASLSAVAMFMTWQTLLPKSPKSEHSGWSGRWHCPCLYVCRGVGKQLHTLPSHPALGETVGFQLRNIVNTHYLLTQHGETCRVLAEEH